MWLRSWSWSYTLTPPPIDYVPVDDVGQAIKILAEHPRDALPLAGGQTLLLLLRRRLPIRRWKRLVEPRILVDVGRIKGLRKVEEAEGRIRIWANTTLSDLLKPENAARCPVLADAVGTIADVQIRNKATVGGALGEAAPGGNIPPLSVLLDGEIVLETPTGPRRIKAADFFVGPYIPALEAGELITRIEMPADLCRYEGHSFLKAARRVNEFAIVTVGVVAKMPDGVIDDVRIVVGNLGLRPIRASKAEEELRGKRPTAELVERAAKLAVAGVKPRENVAASAEYRAHLAYVYTKRALSAALL